MGFAWVREAPDILGVPYAVYLKSLGRAAFSVRHNRHRHPEVLSLRCVSIARGASKDGIRAIVAHPSRLASLAPQDDG